MDANIEGQTTISLVTWIAQRDMIVWWGADFSKDV